MKASLEESNYSQYREEVSQIMKRDNCSQLNGEIRHAKENEPENYALIEYKQGNLISVIQDIESMIDRKFSKAQIQEVLDGKVKV